MTLRSVLFLFSLLIGRLHPKQSDPDVFGKDVKSSKSCYLNQKDGYSTGNDLFVVVVSSFGGYSSDISNADMIRNTSAPEECFINCSSIVIEQTSSAYTIILYFTTDNTKIFLRLRVKWFRCQVPYYPNSNAFFNFMELCITLSGDVHPLPGPNNVHNELERAHICAKRLHTGHAFQLYGGPALPPRLK